MVFLNFVIGACSFLILLFSLHLFYAKQGNRILNRLLAIILFARFGQIVVYLLISSGELGIFPLFQQLFTPLYYAAPACFYLYIRYFTSGWSAFRKYDYLHYIPALLAVIHIIPWDFSSHADWETVASQIRRSQQLFITQKTGLFPPYFHYVLRPALLIAYLLLAWYTLLRSKTVLQQQDSISRKWLLFYMSMATVFQVMSFIPLFFQNQQASDLFVPCYIFINSVTLVLAFSFILHHPRLLYGFFLVSVNWKRAAETKETTVNGTVSKKAVLLPQQLDVYCDAMKTYMENEKPFLDPDFQIVHLAQKLNIPVHHCSFVINNVIGKNFRDWINAYRIEDFMLQHTSKADKMTIEAIAYECGFKSLSTFYNAFKKETGLIPTAYFSDIKQKQL